MSPSSKRFSRRPGPLRRVFFSLMFCFSFAIAAPTAGVNLVSVGNWYGDPQFQDAPADRLLGELKGRGMGCISLRVTWSSMEKVEGTYDPIILSNMERLFQKAAAHGFTAMLDFHTLFMRDNYACPAWVTNQVQDDGTPCIRSLGMLARSKGVRDRYLAMISGVTAALSHCSAIDVVSVMNEPFALDWKNESSWNKDMDVILSVIEEAARRVREKAPGRKVAVRFCGAVNPWSAFPLRRFDPDRTLAALDIIGQNIYIDPNRDDAAKVEKLMRDPRPTISWSLLGEGSRRCREAGKALWITEFGAPWTGTGEEGISGSPEIQADYFQGFCRRFWGDSIRPQAVLAWVIQPNPRQVDGYGLYDGSTGTFRPAFEVYTRYALGKQAP